MTTNQGYELGWDDEIEESGPSFVLLPAGDYNFEVTKFERSRYQGGANLPPCNMAILTLKIDGGEHGSTTVIDRLYLHSSTEGFLSDRKSTRLNSSHVAISYAVFCLNKTIN